MLTKVFLPVAGPILGLCTWYLARKRGWNQVLPIFSLYVAFYCISACLLLSLAYCSLYPGPMQATICWLYSYGYFSVQIATWVFVLAMLYELLSFTSRNRAKIQARVVAILAAMAVAAAFTLHIANKPASGAVDYCLRLAYLESAFGEAVELIVCGLFVVMIILKIRRRLRWGRGISLIVIGLIQGFVVQFALSVAVYNGHLKRVPDVVAQISSLTWSVLWLLAVCKAPNESAAPPKAAVVPAT